MHILVFPSWYPYDTQDIFGVFFRDQALAIKSLGHEVGVIAPMTVSPKLLFRKGAIRQPEPFELDNGIPTYRANFIAALPRIPFGNYFLFMQVARRLFGEYIKHYGKPDVIHAHCAVYAGAAANKLGEEFGVPVVITEHSSAFALGKFSPWQWRLARRSYRDADALVSVSPALSDQLTRHMPETEGRWRWVANVVADRFQGSVGSIANNERMVFLNLARIDENKGQRDLIEAFAGVRDKGLDAELWIAGAGPLRALLENQVNEHGLAECVRFLGPIEPERVPELLRGVSAMVIASHYETFGVVAAEALMCGLPVIATKSGGPECIVQKGDGLLVSVRDVPAMTAAMLELAGSLDQYSAEAIASRAVERFSADAVARKLIDVYLRVLRGGD